jgi:hypothetical protein
MPRRDFQLLLQAKIADASTIPTLQSGAIREEISRCVCLELLGYLAATAPSFCQDEPGRKMKVLFLRSDVRYDCLAGLRIRANPAKAYGSTCGLSR